MGKLCHGTNLEYSNESRRFARLSTSQRAWLTKSVDAMEHAAAPTIFGAPVRRAIEHRFAENFGALSIDEWTQVAARALGAATSAGRIAAQLAELDGSQEIRRRHALAALQAVRAICDRTASLTRLDERRGRLVGTAGDHEQEAIRIAS